ncbi:MAG TPA: tetratricopeptide repeat protein [Pseudomonadales bacterium]|nr:tetratricopeptide repeat protein [Pseudomonadales bacterium]
MTADSSQTLTAEQKNTYLQAIQSLKNHQLDKALLTFKQLQMSRPDFAGAWLGEGDVLIQQQQWQSALSALNRAEQINPTWPLIFTRQAFCFRQLGQFDRAELAYQKALQLKPDYALAHFNYAILLDLYLHETAKAIQHFEAYQHLQSSPDPEVVRWLKELKNRDKKSTH